MEAKADTTSEEPPLVSMKPMISVMNAALGLIGLNLILPKSALPSCPVIGFNILTTLRTNEILVMRTESHSN
jgi:hypothetical protein